MLQAIDQWAFQVLMVLYGALGVVDIPRESNEDWQVVERWVEQADKSYLLVLESSTFASKCVANPKARAIFPQTFFGVQEVWKDNHILFTNSMSEQWNLKTLFDRPEIICRNLIGGQKITFKVYSYIHFFNGIPFYPSIFVQGPLPNFFYNSIYLVAAFFSLFMGIFGAFLMKRMSNNRLAAYMLLTDFTFSLITLAYVPGYLFDANIKYFAFLFSLSISTGFICLVKPIFYENRNFYFFITILANAILCSSLFGLANALQLLTLLHCLLFVVFLIYANIIIFISIKKSNGRFAKTEQFMFLIILLMAMHAIYVADISREGYYHISILIIFVSIVNFYKVIKQFQEKDLEYSIAGEKSKSESAVIAKLSELHEMYREVVHDLKSPISALNFVDSTSQDGVKTIGKLKVRFNEILNKFEKNNALTRADWYLQTSLSRCVEDVFLEKSSLNINFLLDNHLKDISLAAFFDPVDMKIIFSEIIDNSLKHKKSDLSVSVTIKNDREFVVIIFCDNGLGVNGQLLNHLGEKGVSTSDGGMGLYAIKKKILSVGGKVNFENGKIGFRVSIYLKNKSARSGSIG